MKFSTWLTAALVSVSVTLAPDASAKVREDFDKVTRPPRAGTISTRPTSPSASIFPQAPEASSTPRPSTGALRPTFPLR